MVGGRFGAPDIEAALSLPVRKNVNVAMNVEANYVLPYNITQFYPEYQKGSLWTEGVGRLDNGFGITRRRVYATIERFMTQFGLNGQACLLRAICETSESSLRHNGLFGDLLHIMFTPSSSKSEDLPDSYARAEEAGTRGQDCSQVYPECTSGILQLFTMLGD
ncbi:hypothetical protein B566_EDAN008670 [Ephemera danica]|nr:hypothetical protein B566_EDAN008670 [Ephemera danica]